jgi:hypothetical protein
MKVVPFSVGLWPESRTPFFDDDKFGIQQIRNVKLKGLSAS